jgi:hypothetical protein
MKAIAVGASVVVLAVLVGSALAEAKRPQHERGHVRAFMDEPVYRAQDVVGFGLCNGTDKSITLPNPAPWQIIDVATGQVVSTHSSVQEVVTVAAGERVAWTAGQQEFVRTPGATYNIVISYYDSAGKLSSATTSFRIRAK